MKRLFLPAFMMATLFSTNLSAQQLGTVKTQYMFPRMETPVVVQPYSSTVYTAGRHGVNTMRGDQISSTKQNIESFVLNPTGASYAVVTRDKKGVVSLEFYGTDRANNHIHKFDAKKYGEPTALAFSPDARTLYVATAKGLYEFETKKLTMLKHYMLPFVATDMKASGNGYFLAMTYGEKVAIYNLEDHKVRTVLSADEKVTDVAFSDNSDLLGVLTSDGVLSVYETRGFTLRTAVDNLGDGLAFAFNNTGKYVAVATTPDTIVVVNLVRDDEREEIEVPDNLSDLSFILDASGNNLLAYTATMSLQARRLMNLEPYFAQLIADGVDAKMTEWMKMMPGETMEAYQLRMEGQAKQRRLFEDDMATDLAGDMLSMSTITLGSYDRDNTRLQMDFSNMPSIYLTVPEEDVLSFTDPNALEFSDARYGLLADDNFELIYARITNTADGKTYIYDNLDRVPMNFMTDNDNTVSLEVLRQQQMEEVKLQEIRQNVVEEAKHSNVISDHTNITVDSKVVPAYNANGDKILNYVVKFTYNVDPEFSAVEDFGPGKYLVPESGAASSMLKIVKEAFEGDFAQYVKPGSKVNINISGTADATPIIRKIAYDGSLGAFEDEPVYQNGQLSALTVTPITGVTTNEQLAFLRAAGVRAFLEKNVKGIDQLDRNYRYNVDVSQDKGSQHRRITTEFTFVDAF